MELLTLENVGKRYQSGEMEFWALRNIELSIEEGEFVFAGRAFRIR